MLLASIEKRKRPSGHALWPAYRYADDGHGTWLFSPKGTMFVGCFGPEATVSQVGQGHRDAGVDVLHLVPVDAWWFAAWARIDGRPHLSIDICTPARHQADVWWSWTDIELDLVGTGVGAMVLEDVDEFEEACAAGLVSADERDAALATVERLRADLDAGAEPFASLGWARLDEAAAQGLAPLTISG